MDKRLLLKYVAGKATKEEQTTVLDWVDKCESNKQYLISLKLSFVAATMPQKEASEQEMNKMRQNILKINAAPHKNNLYKTLFFISTAAAVIVAIAFFLQSVVNHEKNILQIKESVLAELKEEQIRIELGEIPAEKLHTIYTEKGVKSTVTLPDGSTVQLNSDTKITFPDKFIGDTREIILSGEGYFKVVSNSAKPMMVNTNKGFSIKVLGTEFNLKSYENDNISETTLYTGSINLITPNVITVISPNEQVIINDKSEIKHIIPTAISDTKAWTQGRLIFDETPMTEVIKMLERWHGVKMTVMEPKILNYRITANFNSESIYQIMYIIKNCSLVDYKIENNSVILFAR